MQEDELLPQTQGHKKAQNLFPPSALTPDALRATQEPHLPPVAVANVAKLNTQHKFLCLSRTAELGDQVSPFRLLVPPSLSFALTPYDFFWYN